MRTFYNLLINNGIAAVVNFTVWFALTFFVFLETESVFATGLIAGVYLVFTALSSMWFGSIVDHHKKTAVMRISSITSLSFYGASALVFFLTPEGGLSHVGSPYLWAFALFLLAGVIAGNLRNIVMPTLVSLLVPEERRAKANGLVGMVMGLSFGTVSVISGLLIAYTGFEGVYALALAGTILALIHVLTIKVPEDTLAHVNENAPKKIDIKGTYALVASIPGMVALILFTTFNNFLGGAFMALMDAYGLSMVSVKAWGIMLGLLSFSFMFGGMAIAKWGLGKNPLRSMLIANTIIWLSCIFFTIQPWLWLLILGMAIYMMSFPFIEAAEQTVIQKVVPYERQGRVFGFAQSIEQMASPITAFLIAPLTQFIFIPFMTTGAGVDLIGDWFGTGPARGIALVFTLTGCIGLIVTLLAFASRHYRLLSAKYLAAKVEESTPEA